MQRLDTPQMIKGDCCCKYVQDYCWYMNVKLTCPYNFFHGNCKFGEHYKFSHEIQKKKLYVSSPKKRPRQTGKKNYRAGEVIAG